MNNKLKEDYCSDLKKICGLIDNPPLGAHGFIKNIHKSFCFLPEEAIKKKFNKICDPEVNVKYKSSNNNFIPKIVHRIWLCSSGFDKMPEAKFLATIKSSVENLTESWLHIIWVNSDTIKNDFEFYFNEQSNVIVKNFETELSLHKLGSNISQLIKDKKLAFACDQLRLEVVYSYGGIYCDIGVMFKTDISSLIRDRNYVFLFGHSLFFQNSLFGARPKDPLFKLLLEVNSNTSLFPRSLLGEINSTSEAYLASGLGITLLYLLLVPENIVPIVFCGNERLIQWGSQRSWYRSDGPVLEGNAVVSETNLSLIDTRVHQSHCLINLL